MNILVIAPHPDDESIGCGGTICVHSARGDRVTAVFLTSGEFGLHGLALEDAWRVREGEAEKASGILGISAVTFLRCPDHQLADAMDHTAQALRPVLQREQPELIYLAHPCDWHPDHRASLPIVQRALRNGGPPTPTLLSYEVLTPLTEYDRAEDISSMMSRKLRAVRAHRSQVGQLRYDRAVRALNEYRGAVSQAGRYAEVFQFLDGRVSIVPQARRADPGWYRVYGAMQEIMRVVPPDDPFILVDEDQLDIADLLAPRHCIPFPEKDGRYSGKPPDDEAAIGELTRVRLSGPTFMVFTWPAFWWLEHYSGLRHYLQSQFQCVLKNDRVLIFDLRTQPTTELAIETGR